MDGGWSVKNLIREIALSATYRQSSASNTEAVTRDPANKLLWHMNRRRLTFEQWRDSVLFHSGQLVESIGAKSGELLFHVLQQRAKSLDPVLAPGIVLDEI